jgi:rare lipoprotein A
VAAAVAVVLAGAGVAGATHESFKGGAVYYSDELKGETMACGGEYQPWKMVAAHRDLPCGTRLKVKNLTNGEVVKVTVKDRGPYGDEDVVLDVSKKAAKKLGFYGEGKTEVKAKILHAD